MTKWETHADIAKPTVIDYVSMIRDFERNRLLAPENAVREKNLNRLFIFAVVIPCSLSILLAMAGYFLGINYFKIAALAALLFGHLGLIGVPFVGIWFYRKPIGVFIRNPLIPQQSNASTIYAVFEHFIPVLAERSKTELDLALASLRVERDALEKRTGLIVGAIEKVGVMPSMLSAVLALTKLISDNSAWTDLYVSVAYVLVGFYAIGVLAHASIIRLDKTMRLFELAISKKKTYKFSVPKR